MPSVKRRASKLLNEYGAAQSELIGKAVVLTDGKAGKVENVWLDELRGLRISIEGHDGRWPVSTPEEQQRDPTHLRGIFHQVDRLESLRDHGQHDAAPRS